jgi:hypothetical protein
MEQTTSRQLTLKTVTVALTELGKRQWFVAKKGIVLNKRNLLIICNAVTT